jgi:type IX secretion system PorP/SprF family membrane protein
MKNKKIIGLCALIIAGLNVFSQDIHFSQFAETPTSINPALAGVTYNTRVIANFKNQWSSVTNKYSTYGFSFEQTIKHRKLQGNYFAVSAIIFRDAAGDAALKTLNPSLGINYIQKINKKMKVSGGAQAGLFYRTIDASNLQWGSQYQEYAYNPNAPSGENVPRSSIVSFDLGGGINLNYLQSDKFLSTKNAAKFDAGISAYHFSLGKSSFFTESVDKDKLKTRVCAYFNGDFNIPNSINAIMPSFLYMRQAGNSVVIVGSLFKFILGDPSTYTANKKPRAISIGGYYRYKDAIIPSMLLQYNKYALGVSYDINISPLTPASRRLGGIELMLRYNAFPGYGINLGRSDTKPSY